MQKKLIKSHYADFRRQWSKKMLQCRGGFRAIGQGASESCDKSTKSFFYEERVIQVCVRTASANLSNKVVQKWMKK